SRWYVGWQMRRVRRGCSGREAGRARGVSVTESKTRNRVRLLAGIVAFMFAAITTRLWFLQVLASEQFTAEANDNQIRLVPVAPVRGEIMDRNGNVLVANKPKTVGFVDRQRMGDQADAVVGRLASG